MFIELKPKCVLMMSFYVNRLAVFIMSLHIHVRNRPIQFNAFNGLLIIYCLLFGIAFSNFAEANTRPRAILSNTTLSVNEQTEFSIDGSQSRGDALTYSWKLLSKPKGIDLQPLISTLNQATASSVSLTSPRLTKTTRLVFELTVTNNLGVKGKAKTSVIVRPVNSPPFADAGSPQTVSLGTQVHLTGSASQDADGTITSYRWKQIQGTKVRLSNSKIAAPHFTPLKLRRGQNHEKLVFSLTVIDDEKARNSKTVEITVVNNPRVQLVSTNFNDNQLLPLPYTNTLRWTVKNVAGVELSGIVLKLDHDAAPGLDVGTISPANIPLWRANEEIEFTASVAGMENAGPGTQSQRWSFTYGQSFPLHFDENSDYLGFTFTTDDTSECVPSVAEARAFVAAVKSYTKISATGQKLDPQANQWACVLDNNSGLIWEVKTEDQGLHDKSWIYSWHSPDPLSNGGYMGKQDNGQCGNNGHLCDTDAFVKAVNDEVYCGFNDWRMPTDEELIGLLQSERRDIAIDMDYFPRTQPGLYWTSSLADDPRFAWYVSFGKGYHDLNHKDSARYVRLVRATN
jgi:hypothetical protein